MTKNEAASVAQGLDVAEIAKAAWDEAWRIAFSEGMSAGHPLGRSYLDCDTEWADSEVVARLAQAAPPAAPVQDAGLKAAADFIQRKADDYAREFGSGDMGSLSFGNDAMRDYHWGLLELADEIRALAAPAAPASETMYGEHRYRIPAGFVLQPIKEAEKSYPTPPAAEAASQPGEMGAGVQEPRCDVCGAKTTDPWLDHRGCQQLASAQQDEREALNKWKADCKSWGHPATPLAAAAYIDGYRAAQQAQAGGEDKRDTERLDWLAQHGAWVAWGRDGEFCRVFHHSDDEDGRAVPFCGWGEGKCYPTAREAIDAALSREQPQGDSNASR